MKLKSKNFADQGIIPKKHVMPGAGGDNLSPQLSWSNPPNKTKSFALLVIDPHPVARNWVHWLLVDIPASVAFLEQGASTNHLPKGSRELMNSFGFVGYGGPQPPRGSGRHPYVFTIYALSVEKIDLKIKTSLKEFERAIKGKVLEKAQLTGFFEQQ